MAFTWDDSAQRFRDASGRFVSNTAVDNGVDAVIRSAAERIRGASEHLQSGAISLGNWQDAMAAEMKPLHVGAAAIGGGGWAQMSQSDWGWTGSELRRQYGYLRGFAEDIATGKQPLDGRLLARSALYAESARATQRAMQRRRAEQIGLEEERNQLGAADRHCASCLFCESQGWVPIGTLPPIGGRECRSRCRCRLIFRDVPAAEEAA